MTEFETGTAAGWYGAQPGQQPTIPQQQRDIGDGLVDRGRRLFEFLAAAQRLRGTPVRTLETYQRDGAVVWLGEIPEHPAVSTAASIDEPAVDEPLLVVQRIPRMDPPNPPPVIEPWLDGATADPDRPPTLRESRTEFTSDGPAEGETISRGDCPDVDAAYVEWQPAWDAWADQEKADRPVRALYKELFATHAAVAGQGEERELILGIGCLGWAPSGHDPVRRHLLVTPAEIAFEQSTGTLTVTPQPVLDALTVELDMLDPARRPAAQVVHDVVQRARTHEEHSLHREATGDLVRCLIYSLDPDARFDDGDTKPDTRAVPVAAFAPALILRRRSRLGLVTVFEQLAAAIAQSGQVPSGLLPLLDPNYRPVVEPDPTPGAMIDIDDDVFLPLPLNDRQLDIIRRVDSQAQTLVQGPPGTGKTHLAAALISHLLAQGKRVLVTAHTDRALKEVRAKLPDAIKPLAVSVVGTERSDMAELRVAVERISQRSSEGDPVVLEAEAHAAIEASLQRIDQRRRRRAELRARLVTAREADVAERSFPPYQGTLAAIAQTYKGQSATQGWLADYVAPDVDTAAPLSTDQAVRWLELLRDRDVAAAEPEAVRRLIDPADLPTPDQFAALVDQRAAAHAAYAAVAGWAQHPVFGPVSALDARTREALAQRMARLARTLSALEQRRDPWIAQALHDIRTGRAATWAGRAAHVRGLLEGAWTSLQHLGVSTRVTLAHDGDTATIESLAQYLRDHVQAGGEIKLNPDGSVKVTVFTGRAVKNSRPLLDNVRVDGRPPTTVEQLTVVLLHLDVERHLQALDQAWPADLQIPAEDTLHERYQWHATERQQLQTLLALGDELAAEQGRFDELGLPQPDWSVLDAVLAVTQVVDAAAAWDAYTAAAAPIQQLEAMTGAARQWGDAVGAVALLDDAVRQADRDGYATAQAQLQWLMTVRARAGERDALTAQVTAAALALSAAVRAAPGDEKWDDQLGGLVPAWDRARVGAWILSQDAEDANDLLHQLDIAEDSLRSEIEKLAGTRAWQHALAPHRLTGQARADLSLYARLVQRLGKGEGKYAAQRRAEIRQAMDRCRPAVPVWIMPIYRIAEQLHVTENMFDVVIVDEASQAGLEATFLQYLAPKIVVIGDDKQVSPSAVGVDQQQLRDLATHYLWDDRYKASWQDPKLSLFDAASIWFGAKRTLVEHRRCVPEIIGFSSRIAYEPDNIRLIPVRQFGSDRLDPIQPVHVPDGYETGSSGNKVNRPEADAIVAQIQTCLADPRYDGKTFGVISLLGPRQAKVINDLLLETLSPDEWTARGLRCGDAAAFQGSERDVMFLSMVSAPEPGQRMGALTVEANVQRYNVAASRAKDQMWVFHTVALAQLTNPADMRFQLLDYCYHAVHTLAAAEDGSTAGLVPEDRPVEPFDSLFEQRVHNRIVERGYTVIPQYESLGYAIDLVIVGPKGRLAVECDGDHWHGPDRYIADLARERDLRRCGWEFFRIRESAFYIHQAQALAPLWDTLQELEICPAGWSTPAADGPAVNYGEDVDADADLLIPAASVLDEVDDAGHRHDRDDCADDDDQAADDRNRTEAGPWHASGSAADVAVPLSRLSRPPAPRPAPRHVAAEPPVPADRAAAVHGQADL